MKTRERERILTSSNPYLQASTAFAFAEKDKHLSPIARLLSPFKLNVWITLALLLLGSSLVILLSKRLTQKWRHFYIGGRVNRSPILNMWNSALGNPLGNPRIANGHYIGIFSRTITFLWFFCWLIIRNSYQGALYTYLQEQKFTSPYDTVEKIQASNAKIVISKTLYQFVGHLFEKER